MQDNYIFPVFFPVGEASGFCEPTIANGIDVETHPHVDSVLDARKYTERYVIPLNEPLRAFGDFPEDVEQVQQNTEIAYGVNYSNHAASSLLRHDDDLRQAIENKTDNDGVARSLGVIPSYFQTEVEFDYHNSKGSIVEVAKKLFEGISFLRKESHYETIATSIDEQGYENFIFGSVPILHSLQDYFEEIGAINEDGQIVIDGVVTKLVSTLDARFDNTLLFSFQKKTTPTLKPHPLLFGFLGKVAHESKFDYCNAIVNDGVRQKVIHTLQTRQRFVCLLPVLGRIDIKVR